MAKAEKFHEMVARVTSKSPAHAQALAAYSKRNGPVKPAAIAAFNKANGNPSVAAPKPGAKVKPPLLVGAMNR